MDPAPIRRWNPGFIAMRWRHLFWGLPLLGLLAGLLVHFLPMIRGTATGVVQIRPGPMPSVTSDFLRTIHSDDILTQTCLRTGIVNRWGYKGGSTAAVVGQLRESVSVHAIPGTALLEITVNGRSRKESEWIWESLVEVMREHYHLIGKAHTQPGLDRISAQVQRQKEEVDSKREALSQAIKTETLLYYANGTPQGFTGQVSMLKAEFDRSQRHLEALQIKLITEAMTTKLMEAPLIIHQAPGTPVSLNLWDTLRPLLLHSSIGLGSGMLLAVILAYLLELLFPRKGPAVQRPSNTEGSLRIEP